MTKINSKYKALIFEELEPRLLFSADGAEALAVDAVEQTIEEQPIIIIEQGEQGQEDQISAERQAVEEAENPVPAEAEVTEQTGNGSSAQESDATVPDDMSAGADTGEPAESEVEGTLTEESSNDATTTIELVIVTGDVEDTEELADTLLPSQNSDTTVEFAVIDGEGDPLSQVTSILQDYENLEVLHFAATLDDGGFGSVDSWLNDVSIADSSEAIGSWGDALAEDGRIVLYGSSSTADDTLLNALGNLTGSDPRSVLASR